MHEVALLAKELLALYPDLEKCITGVSVETIRLGFSPKRKTVNDPNDEGEMVVFTCICGTRIKTSLTVWKRAFKQAIKYHLEKEGHKRWVSCDGWGFRTGLCMYQFTLWLWLWVPKSLSLWPNFIKNPNPATWKNSRLKSKAAQTGQRVRWVPDHIGVSQLLLSPGHPKPYVLWSNIQWVRRYALPCAHCLLLVVIQCWCTQHVGWLVDTCRSLARLLELLDGISLLFQAFCSQTWVMICMKNIQKQLQHGRLRVKWSMAAAMCCTAWM